jgi:hypothetical protein
MAHEGGGASRILQKPNGKAKPFRTSAGGGRKNLRRADIRNESRPSGLRIVGIEWRNIKHNQINSEQENYM